MKLAIHSGISNLSIGNASVDHNKIEKLNLLAVDTRIGEYKEKEQVSVSPIQIEKKYHINVVNEIESNRSMNDSMRSPGRS